MDNYFNTINEFLALHDYNENMHYDLILVLGSAIPFIALEGYKLYLKGKADYFMIAGGKGHTTQLMINQLSSFVQIENKDMSEAEILKKFIESKYGKDDKIIIETKSKNCGENIKFAFDKIDQEKITVQSVLLLHDPLMQRRIDAVSRKEFPNTQFNNYCVFVPRVGIINNKIVLAKSIEGQWPEKRYISLLLGEMKRVIDNQEGYGPLGKNFIAHVNVPWSVLEAYGKIREKYSDFIRV